MSPAMITFEVAMLVWAIVMVFGIPWVLRAENTPGITWNGKRVL